MIDYSSSKPSLGHVPNSFIEGFTDVMEYLLDSIATWTGRGPSKPISPSPDHSLGTAVQYASYFLTACITKSHSSETVDHVRSILTYNLYHHCALSWDPKRPTRGSLRRSLTFNLALSTDDSSSKCHLPPTPVYDTCVMADIQWFEWMDLLGNVDFELFIDPGCVSFVRCGIDVRRVVLWAADWGPEELGNTSTFWSVID